MSVRTKSYRGSSDVRTETVDGSRLQADGNIAVYAGAERDTAGRMVVRTDGSAAPQDLTVRGSSVAAGLNPDSEGRAVLRASGTVDIGEANAQFNSRLESRSTYDNGWSYTQSRTMRSALHSSRESPSRKPKSSSGSRHFGRCSLAQKARRMDRRAHF